MRFLEKNTYRMIIYTDDFKMENDLKSSYPPPEIKGC